MRTVTYGTSYIGLEIEPCSDLLHEELTNVVTSTKYLSGGVTAERADSWIRAHTLLLGKGVRL